MMEEESGSREYLEIDSVALRGRDFEGRSRNMFQTYKIVFKMLSVHSVEIEKFVFGWDKMVVAGLLNEASVSVLKQASAVVTLLQEVAGLEMPVRLSLVAQVKKG